MPNPIHRYPGDGYERIEPLDPVSAAFVAARTARYRAAQNAFAAEQRRAERAEDRAERAQARRMEALAREVPSKAEASR